MRAHLLACVWFFAISVTLAQPLPASGADAGSRTGPLGADARLPAWPKPVIIPTNNALSVRSGELEILQSPDVLGAYTVRVAGRLFAVGQSRPMLGYVKEDRLAWFNFNEAPDRKCAARAEGKGLLVSSEASDSDGARWHISQLFSPGARPGVVDVQTEIQVDKDRAVAFLPMLVLFPGSGSFGEHKGQALFAGVEYLEDEPSSSEADVIGPAARRQVPDALKLTFPLMAVQNAGSYLALTWQMRPQFSAVFDSPDRLFGSGGHVMGLIFPGSNGRNREEGNLLPRAPELLKAGATLTLRAGLLGARGSSVADAVAHYLSWHPLPPLAQAHPGLQQYVRNAEAGWADSAIRQSNLVRHAVWPNAFGPQPAADAAVWAEWLAQREQDPARAQELQQVSRGLLSAVPPQMLNESGVGHVRYPVPALVFGHIKENADRSAERARSLLKGFAADGSLKYQPRPGGVDFARTHYTNEANGLASRVVLDLLENAAFAGDRDLLKQGIEKLRALGRFRNSVPRGAQTWECPLHTPDILASAQLVRVYTLGYELTGEPDFLEQARYWAWTGVPFVYLVNPTDKPIGPYATIAVYGATQWKAPVWLGLPVQWCGLVYAEALYRLAPHDQNGPWQKLADGITLSGIQQSWPVGEKENQGLLPDSFVLREQRRNGPAINPATVQACAAFFYRQTPVYTLRNFPSAGVLVHAPGALARTRETGSMISFSVEPCLKGVYYLLINGVAQKPQLALNGARAEIKEPHGFDEIARRLILRLEGTNSVALNFLPKN